MPTKLVTGQILPAVMVLASIAPAAGTDMKRNQLENGLSVVYLPSKATDQVALVVLYAIGEDHDPPDRCGLSHLSEHVYITAAAGNVPARTVHECTNRYPNAWNAQTGTDYTVFATVFPKGQLEEELRDAAARMSKLRVTDADLKREKPRLLNELQNMYDGFPPLASMNHARTYIRPSTVGHRKGGLPKHVEGMTVDEVSAWWSKYYKPSNATVVLAGAFTLQTARELVEKHFASIPSGNAPPPAHKPGTPKLGLTRTVAIKPTLPNAQPHACIAFSPPRPGEKHYAACLLIVSRLWMRAASSGGKPQVMFSVLDDPTLIAVSSPVGPLETRERVLASLRSFLEQAATAPVQPFEKQATKNNLGALLGLVDFPDVMLKQNLYGVAFSIGRREQMRLNSAELSKELNDLTDESLKAATEAIFAPKQQVAVVAEPES